MLKPAFKAENPCAARVFPTSLDPESCARADRKTRMGALDGTARGDGGVPQPFRRLSFAVSPPPHFRPRGQERQAGRGQLTDRLTAIQRRWRVHSIMQEAAVAGLVRRHSCLFAVAVLKNPGASPADFVPCFVACETNVVGYASYGLLAMLLCLNGLSRKSAGEAFFFPALMSRLTALKAAKSLGDLAKLLDFKPKGVSYILYKQPAASKYATFQIPKRSGGHRTIKAPSDSLKLLQQRLSDFLQDCVDEINAVSGRRDRAAHGFKRKRSIITNARQHRHRRWVFNVDLEDFFLSINFGRIRGFFIKTRAFELQEAVATVITQIACHENSLPQGSPCSPVISNLIAHLLDMRLVKLASESGCTYSRYADDLTFSTNKRDFPSAIAVPSAAEGAGSHVWLAGEALRKVIESAGFRINAKKTHLMYRASRQSVTGLVVNERINVRWEYRHNVRAMVDRLVRTGHFDLLAVKRENGGPVLEERPGTLNELHGMLGFIDSVESLNKNETSDSRPRGKSSREKVYREFLLYSTFYAAPTPVIICEGETDNVYLTHAIRSLAAAFPTLAEVAPGGKIRLKVRLYKYPRSSTARVLDLKDGGSSVLSRFIAAYKKETKRFTGPGLKEPVVIVYDSDDGAKSIRNTIKSVSGVKPIGSEPFVHIVKNLYAVATPVEPGGESRIEDLFDAKTKGTVIDGKTFNEGHDFDPDRHYGKKVFAHRVVRPNADKIDFGGFRPLLTTVAAAIDEHAGRP